MPDVERAGASRGWRNVDSDAASAVRYLDRLSSEMAEIKARVTALLHLVPGQTALEVGCGLRRTRRPWPTRWHQTAMQSVSTSAVN